MSKAHKAFALQRPVTEFQIFVNGGEGIQFQKVKEDKTKFKKLFEYDGVLIYYLVQTLPCDSQPCLNAAMCTNDVKDITKYHCKCTGDYSGVNCQGKLCNACPNNAIFFNKNNFVTQFWKQDFEDTIQLMNNKPLSFINLCSLQ